MADHRPHEDADRPERTATEAAGRMLGSALASGRRAASVARETIRRSPRADRVYRTAVGVTGGTTVALGVVLMPLPGPGALIALGGLSMLGTEFETAKRINVRATRAVTATAAAVAERRTRKRERAAARDADPADPAA